MATVSDLLLDAVNRVQESVHGAVEGLTDDQLVTPPARGANTVAWLVWHLSRVMDDHVADAFIDEQVWVGEGWAPRFHLPFDVHDHGYGQSFEQVLQVRAPSDLLLGYHDAVHAYVVRRLEPVDDSDLDRVVDERWDPPVTLGIRLVSVVNDATQHVGQAAYAAGILQRS